MTISNCVGVGIYPSNGFNSKYRQGEIKGIGFKCPKCSKKSCFDDNDGMFERLYEDSLLFLKSEDKEELKETNVKDFEVVSDCSLPNGRSYYVCICPFCQEKVNIQKWSFLTTGKKCSCGAVLRSSKATKRLQNENLVIFKEDL
jgi:hypothetical protein